MAKVKSVFGTYADRLQVLIDNSLDRFEPTWFQQYFDFGPPQISLTFLNVIGRSRVEAAASVIARGSEAPLRARPGIEKYSGEIPAIAEKLKMEEEVYRNLLVMQQIPFAGGNSQFLIDLMFNDVRIAGNSGFKRLDYMTLEGLSTGQITLTTTNNPDGTVLTTAIDLLFPSTNKTNAAVNWATIASSTPITDIRNVREIQRARGVRIVKVLMSEAAWTNFYKSTEVKDFYATFVGKINNKVMPTLDNINQLMQDHKLPIIEIVDQVIGVEKNGVITTYKPFKDENVVFVPEGNLGVIHNAIPIETLSPVENVNYANLGRSLISKWRENEPWAEWTKVELNAFPGINVDFIHILSTNLAF